MQMDTAGRPCVVLDLDVRRDDRLLLMGYPNYGAGPQSDGLTAIYEADTRSPDSSSNHFLHKFKWAHVVRGFSGGPVLNLRTGRVIGVITETRDSGSAIGGWAIPTELILAVLPELGAAKATVPAAPWDRALGRQALQPKLFLGFPPPDAAGLNRFYYGARKVPFVGREQEMSRLGEFLDDQRPFVWWLVAGAGGFGKSRLALELCLRREPAWHTGFLRDWNGGELAEFQPERPTLLVIDYASARAEELGQVARRLFERGRQLSAPVRLLLLERDMEEEKEQWLIPPPDPLESGSHIKVSFPQRMLAVELRM